MPATLTGMETPYGKRLQTARKRAGIVTQEALGDRVGRSGKAVRNWETGKNEPDEAMKQHLRELLGPFDEEPGDPVEVAVRNSVLTEDRQYEVLSVYTRNLREQREAQAG